jgi:cell division protease FtsH
MTRKPVKVQRRKSAAGKKAARSARPAKERPSKTPPAVSTAPVDALPEAIPFDVDQGLVVAEAPPPAKPTTKKKALPPARCALVASAFQQSTNGAIRRQLKAKGPMAVIVMVPEPGWIEPVRTLFVSRFGARWESIDGIVEVEQEVRHDRCPPVRASRAHRGAVRQGVDFVECQDAAGSCH